MENVESDEDKSGFTKTYRGKSSGLNMFIQKIGLAKSDKGADTVSLIVAAIFLLLALGVYSYFFMPISIFHPSTHSATNDKMGRAK